jgi:SLOG-like protein
VRSRIVGVDGLTSCPPIDFSHAVELTGYEVDIRQAVFLIAGLTGAIEVATQEAKAAGGLTIGIPLGYSPQGSSPYIALSIVIGLSEARNPSLFVPSRFSLQWAMAS